MEELQDPQVDPETARRAAREILARPEYQPRADSLLRRFLRWLGDLFQRADPSPVGAPAGSPGRMSPVAVVVLVVLLALVAYLLYRLVRAVWRDGLPRRRRRVEDDEVEVVADARPDGATGADEADRLEAEGRRREAVLVRYRATVARLTGAGWLAPTAGSSTGELRGELRGTLADAAPPFDGLSDAFEDVHYGGRDPDAELVADARAHADAVLGVAARLEARGVRPLRADPAGSSTDALDLLDDEVGPAVDPRTADVVEVRPDVDVVEVRSGADRAVEDDEGRRR